MKNLNLLLIGLLLIPTLFLTSCDRGDDPTPPVSEQDQAAVLKSYMINNQYDLQHIIGGTGMASPASFVVDAPAKGSTQAQIDAFLSTYTIMDLRSATDFNAGKLPGATNVLFKDILTFANAATKPILVVCYSGNTATYATALLRMYGKRDARTLKWGMSGWHSTFANHATSGWNNRISNDAATSSNWNPANTPAPAVATYPAPKVMSLLTAGDALLKARVEAVVAEGFKAIDPKTLLSNPSTHFIVNYFSNTDFLAYGHVKGAHRIQPFNLAGDQTGNLTNLNIDASKPVAVYCYTGQTSGIVTAWLRVLGYDAYSGVQGMNRFWNDNPGWGTSGNKWKTDKPSELAY